MTKKPPKTEDAALNQRVKEFTRYLLLLRKIQDKDRSEFLKKLGSLSLQELNILNTIGDFEPCIMSDIAKNVALSLSSVTVIVDKLVKNKLVKRIRKEDDRRVVYGCLTPEGHKVYAMQIEHVHAEIRKLFGVLSKEEQESLLSIFEKFATTLM